MKFTDITLADISLETKVETLGIALDKALSEVSSQVSTVSTTPGPQGPKGEKGEQGPQGLPGRNGIDGKDGKDGISGKDGEDGVSIVDVTVAADNSLVVKLSNGKEIDAGSLELLAGSGKGNVYHTSMRTNEVPVYAVRYDEISENLAYRGEAISGNTESALVWRIQKIEIVDNDVTITWANGATSFINAWTDRLSLIYS